MTDASAVTDNLSIILPCLNEAESLKSLIPELVESYPHAEIIIVDDGSTDDTAAVCDQYPVTRLAHPYSRGNGAAVKSGVRAACGEIVVLMDADGQHPVSVIDELLRSLKQGYDMVVGARSRSSQASMGRLAANTVYNWLATQIVGHPVPDLTSGFRAVYRDKFNEFLYLLPNGFSYPTTITMAFFRSGYPVAYVPFEAPRREGKSHLNPLKDGIRFLLIIFRVATLYSPLKLFFPASMFLILLGCGYGLYTLLAMHRFTNMSTLLLLTGCLVFFFGLLAEQVTFLLYKK